MTELIDKCVPIGLIPRPHDDCDDHLCHFLPGLKLVFVYVRTVRANVVSPIIVDLF